MVKRSFSSVVVCLNKLRFPFLLRASQSISLKVVVVLLLVVVVVVSLVILCKNVSILVNKYL